MHRCGAGTDGTWAPTPTASEFCWAIRTLYLLQWTWTGVVFWPDVEALDTSHNFGELYGVLDARTWKAAQVLPGGSKTVLLGGAKIRTCEMRKNGKPILRISLERLCSTRAVAQAATGFTSLGGDCKKQTP